MVQASNLRHSKWYEKLVFHPVFLFLMGFLIVVIAPAYYNWGTEIFKTTQQAVVYNSWLIAALAFTSSFFILKKVKQYPGAHSLAFIIPTQIFVWLTLFAIFFLLRENKYSIFVVLTSFSLAIWWDFISHFLAIRFTKPKLAIVPFGEACKLIEMPQINAILLEEPHLQGKRYDGIVADLHSKDLPAKWERFIAQCTLAQIPVYHSLQLIESLTGRVQVEHLQENIFGTLRPSTVYSGIKRVADILGVILLSPIFLPIMLITAILIKRDSPGDIFFTQKRMGYQGKEFKIYKFRSMRTDIEGKGFTESEDDPRITKLGKFIRKFRIDEIPQIINILKGEMSFIGPRPESLKLSEWYEKDVPFFNYRHVVRPGISGWAQVTQGYAAEIDGMKEKLEYDFYYIKNFSIWLDALIVFKTLKTILTGFGAR